MDEDLLARRLLQLFLEELEEHVRAFNREVVILEKTAPAEPAYAAHLDALFRVIHIIKGASRAASVHAIEEQCHALETLLLPARDGRAPLTPADFELLYAAADSLAAARDRLLRGAPVVAAVAPAAAPTPAATMRVSAARLDALLAHSTELFVARRRWEHRIGAAEELLAAFEAWRGDWQALRPPFRRFLEESGANRRTIDGFDDRLQRSARDLAALVGGLRRDQRALERAAVPLGAEVRRARMVPLSEACQGLERAARDLAAATEKPTELVIHAGDLELDRTVAEALHDCLLHLVRNAIDHGIEPTEERRRAGKPVPAVVTIAAELRDATIAVRISDDGRGLDREAIRAQARRRGLAFEEDDLEQLIFRPGFSTARLITDVSGRGVGLDVVQHHVQQLHGAIDVASERGRGTTITLLLPVTTSLLRVLLVVAGGETLALVSANVERLVRVAVDELHTVDGRQMLALPGGRALIPVASLARTLSVAPRQPPLSANGKLALVVLAAAGRRVAFVVEELAAETEVVLQSLGPRLAGAPRLSGATMLPSGRIALVLNSAELVAHALAGAAAIAVEPAPPVVTAKKRILLADDSLTTRALERSILEAAGYDVIAVNDGMEAWWRLQESGADLLVADVEMPRMDGFALTQAVRGSPRFRELPVVLVTARDSDVDKARGLEVGASAYLVKSSFDQRSLLAAVAQLL